MYGGGERVREEETGVKGWQVVREEGESERRERECKNQGGRSREGKLLEGKKEKGK